MKLTIWQQFSSNHSSHFIVVGRFATLDEAAENAHQLRDWMYRMMWGQDREAAEQEIKTKYGIEWYENGIDWNGWPTHDGDVVQCVERDLFMMCPMETWDSKKPFDSLIEVMGAETIWSLRFNEIYLNFHLTITAPSDEAAELLCQQFNTLNDEVLGTKIRPIQLNTDQVMWFARTATAHRDGMAIRLSVFGLYFESGEPHQITQASPLIQALTQGIDPQAEFNLDYTRSAPGTGPTFGLEGEDTSADSFAMTINWDLGDFRITSITSQLGYDYDVWRDTDYTNLSFLTQNEIQDYSAFGQELRLTSPTSDQFEYIVGAYYSSEELSNDKRVDADFNSVPPVAGFLTGSFGVPVAALTGSRNQRFQQDTTSWAVFAQGTWYLTEQLRFTGGLRYTEDEKDSVKELFYSTIGTNDVNPLVSAVYPNLGFGVVQAVTNRSRSEDAVTGEAIIEYDWTDDVMLFARYARGFKAGGFDEDNVQDSPDSAVFEPETVDSFEAGIKSEFANGAGRFNATVFFNTFEDLQVSTFDGVASFIVGNAASAETVGVEADIAYQVTNAWDIAASIGILDATYKDFPNGPAVFGGGASQDLSGRPLQFAPDVTLNFMTGYEAEVFSGWIGRGEISGYYNSGYEVPGDLDPFLAQDSFFKLGARLSLGSYDGNWDFSLIGKNLTDEATTQWGNDVPLGNLLGNNYFQRIDPPRTVTIQAVRNF